MCQWKTFLSTQLEAHQEAECTPLVNTWSALASLCTPRSTVIRNAAVGLVVRVGSLRTKTTVIMPIIGQYKTIPGRTWTLVGGASSNNSNNLLLGILGFKRI